jgi:hypothetical protein
MSEETTHETEIHAPEIGGQPSFVTAEEDKPPFDLGKSSNQAVALLQEGIGALKMLQAQLPLVPGDVPLAEARSDFAAAINRLDAGIAALNARNV